MLKRALLFLFLLALLVITGCRNEPADEGWTKLSLGDFEIKGTMSADMLFAFGPGGIYRSEDGIKFDLADFQADTPFDMIFTKGEGYFAATKTPTYYLWYSKNGADWIALDRNPFRSRVYSVCWDGKRFVAIGYNNVLYISEDGLFWDYIRDNPYSGHLDEPRSIRYINGDYIVTYPDHILKGPSFTKLSSIPVEESDKAHNFY